jgi:tRNA-2-methylthio-N6-dimethylallyladenosine synthase
MKTYSIWTVGCQMNKAESQYIVDLMQCAGYTQINLFREADIVVLNTCVVRQSAEDKVIGMLNYLKGIKKHNSNLKIIVTGCFVNSDIASLKDKYPYVDLFFKPGDIDKLKDLNTFQCILPTAESRLAYIHNDISMMVPIIQGCNNYCTYCIVPFRRGKEVSRTIQSIIDEVITYISRGVKEIVLLGQNVNSYGHDLHGKQNLSILLKELHKIDDLKRIRFLTNHPKDMDIELIETIASLPKVCKHLNLPVQSGDNDILNLMGRQYKIEHYIDLVEKIRSTIPDIALSTDIIIGFPGETAMQFNNTLDIIKKIKFDTIHVAAYSPRIGTRASEIFIDDISQEVKQQRLQEIEKVQTIIAYEINNILIDSIVEVLVIGKKNNKWFGRTESDKLVFFNSSDELQGQFVQIIINKASSWSLQGKLEYGS